MAKISESYKASSAVSMWPMGNLLASKKSSSSIPHVKITQPFLIHALLEMGEDLNEVVVMNVQILPDVLTNIRTCERNV
jgi:hypothetical protein